jgi:hypothetical protein
VLAIAQSIVNLLVAGGSGADTIGHNYLLIIALAFIAAAAGRIYGLDGMLIRRFPHVRIFHIRLKRQNFYHIYTEEDIPG